MISLSALSRDIDHLEPFPVSVPRLAHALTDDQISTLELARIIEYDPVLTANALRMANSAYYSPGVPVVAVRDAVMRLGAGRILQQAVGQKLRGKLTQACPGFGLDETELWRHSVAAAVAAELLPRHAKVSIHPVAFTAALLHDIGKLVLSRHLAAEIIEEIAATVRERQLSHVEAERAVLGFDHAQVGGVIARRWNFPEPLAHAIAHHHRSREGGENSALDAVHVSNAVAKIIGEGIGSEQMNMPVNADAAQALGLTPASLESLCADAAHNLPEVLALYEDEADGQ